MLREGNAAASSETGEKTKIGHVFRFELTGTLRPLPLPEAESDLAEIDMQLVFK
jgi:hypothetical protein